MLRRKPEQGHSGRNWSSKYQRKEKYRVIEIREPEVEVVILRKLFPSAYLVQLI